MRKNLEDAPLAIVRAWGGEPVVLRVHGSEPAKRRFLVGSDSAEKPISLPESDVFAYDPTIMEQLEAAYASGDSALLSSLYEEAKRRKSVLQ
jgi:hypothetical protein